MQFSGPEADRLAIRELIEAYADAVNRHDGAAWGALWAEDGCWTVPGIGRIAGRAAIVAAWTAAMAAFAGVVFTAVPGAIRVSGDAAQARSYTDEVYERDGVTRRDRGVYEDELVRIGGWWRFRSRVFRHLHRG